MGQPNTRLRLTAEQRQVLASCVKTAIGLLQIAVATGARGLPLPDRPCTSCGGTGRVPGSATLVCHPCRGRGHSGNTALCRKVEVARSLLARLEA